MSDELKVTIDAVREAAKIAIDYFGKEEKELDIRHKPDNSIVTIADLKTEEVIKSNILGSFPDAEFITEEAEDTVSDYKDVWTIDPIDGTFEFSRGINYWAVLASYAREGEFLLGVCYFPVFDVLLYAEKGKGAFVDGKKINVSEVASLEKATMAYTALQHFKNSHEKDALYKVSESVRSSRVYNSAFSGFCVASGKLDLFLTSSGIHIWDIAPFITIINEAGGKITDWEGSQLNVKNENTKIVASNGLFHNEILAKLNGTE